MLAAHAQPLGIEPRLLHQDEGTPDPLLGSQVGPYRLIALLGRGGMGSVWRAQRVDGVLDREVAVKLMRLLHSASLRAATLPAWP